MCVAGACTAWCCIHSTPPFVGSGSVCCLRALAGPLLCLRGFALPPLGGCARGRWPGGGGGYGITPAYNTVLYTGVRVGGGAPGLLDWFQRDRLVLVRLIVAGDLHRHVGLLVPRLRVSEDNLAILVDLLPHSDRLRRVRVV